MNPNDARTARVAVTPTQIRLAEFFGAMLQRFARHAEAIALFVAVSAFWGLILYTALTTSSLLP